MSDAVPRPRIAIITGSRAEFGLLRPVMHAVRAHPSLELLVIAAGAHLIPPGETYREVKAEFAEHLADAIVMQTAGRTTRADDAEAVGVGISRFARSFARLAPDWIVVLGDRVEAFAAGAAASISGLPLAHVHGGDRAEGVADEALRHAITKLAHLHFPATRQSAERILRMGEREDRVHVVGSPAIDGLDAIPALTDARACELGDPDTVFLVHPVGRDDATEQAAASEALGACAGRRVLILDPNHDPGRAGILRALEGTPHPRRAHLPRSSFVGLLKRLASRRGLLLGNSSAALIEGAHLRCPAVDIGPRQSGRERAGNAIHADAESRAAIDDAIRCALALDLSHSTHPYGDGRAGPRIAEILGATARDPALTRKLCTY